MLNKLEEQRTLLFARSECQSSIALFKCKQICFVGLGFLDPGCITRIGNMCKNH